ncbi:hypothetical protein, partial [Streptomyces sp. NPDC056982]|uniref:hypothetical protein n=1 Tax=Streptomyces sp. NPDC056982 TaxID=3345986 RepID=UPI00363B9288
PRGSSQEHAEVHAHLVEDASVCQDQAVNKPSIPARLNRALDWAGLPLSALFLAIGIRDYRDGESVGWPIGGAGACSGQPLGDLPQDASPALTHPA